MSLCEAKGVRNIDLNKDNVERANRKELNFSIMEDPDPVASLIDSTTSKIQQLQKAFAELESHRAITLNLKWKELEAHFHGLEKSLKRRFHELEDQEKEYESKTVETREMLEKREAAVVTKEQASLERLQEKRDAAIFSISNALKKNRNVSCMEPVIVSTEGQDMASIEEERPPAVSAECKIENASASENRIPEVVSYPDLVKLCEEMDSDGLHKFISDNRKNLATIREEIPLALKAAANPAELVLDSLKDFYPVEVSTLDGKKDANLLGLRRTCIMLMECLSVLLASKDTGSVSELIPEEVKEHAKAFAEQWKPKLVDLDTDASNGNSLEAHAFLQLLATFNINSDFDQEELSKLIPLVSRRRQTADLCRSLGLTEKMPGVIEVLINSGRQIDAVNLAFAFELTEQFSPVSLLKSYLKDAKKASSPAKPGNSSPTVQDEVNEKELTALKAVIKSIEEHKLEEQYPVDPLQKRVLLLEKVKADKKRANEATKPQSKRPRANSAGYGPRVTNVATDKTVYARVNDRYSQYMYDRPYIYTGPTDNHVPSLLGSATYGLSPAHGNFFGNGYQYQAAAYLH
ncbi:Frigida-like [Dillenia turbinata]|uniref:FRIGIDA-like protein n=1 Tax=Dillenia turbinata TaxID=194707 RepID=A0AAN8W716_9MAGN